MFNPDGTENTDEYFIGNINAIRYRGYYYDVETGLYYLMTRYYDPTRGRFISPDDVSYLDPATIQGLNLFAYCGNNPVMGIDPEGTLEWWYWLITAVVAAASIALSIATFGVATAATITVVGGLIGAGFGAISAAMNGQDVLQGFGMGFLTGTIMANTAAVGSYVFYGGFLAGTTAPMMSGFQLAAVGGFAGGALNEWGTQLSNSQEINKDAIFNKGFQGAFFNLLDMGIGSYGNSNNIGALGSSADRAAETFGFNYIFGLITNTFNFLLDFIK